MGKRPWYSGWRLQNFSIPLVYGAASPPGTQHPWYTDAGLLIDKRVSQMELRGYSKREVQIVNNACLQFRWEGETETVQ